MPNREWNCSHVARAGQGSLSVTEPRSTIGTDMHPQFTLPLYKWEMRFRNVLPAARGHRAVEPGSEPRPVQFQPWHFPVSGAALLEVGSGCLMAHLARVTRWHQEFLFLPCL